MTDVEIGRVNDFFGKISVIGVDLTGELRVGDMIHVQGHTTDISQVVESMQVEHGEVDHAEAGASVGLKVGERCRKGDHVYKVTAQA